MGFSRLHLFSGFRPCRLPLAYVQNQRRLYGLREVGQGVDADGDQRVAAAMGALAHPSRLAILREVRTPRVLADIKVRSSSNGRIHHGERQGRLLARQTVQQHLSSLLQIGVISSRESKLDKRRRMEYVINHQTLYSLAESFLALAELRPDELPDSPTITDGIPGEAEHVLGPHLVLVKGLGIGQHFPLDPVRGGTHEWMIGRRQHLPVCLDYDPYVSKENCLVQWRDGIHSIVDLPGSRNGTRVNFQPLDGARRMLRTGDLIGVGHSLLLFRA